MTNWKGCEQKQLWPRLRYLLAFALKGLRKTTKSSFWVTSLWTEIWACILLNEEQECSPLCCDVWWYNFLAQLDSTSDTVIFPIPGPFTGWMTNGHFIDIICCADCCLQQWQVWELYSVYHRSSLVLCSVPIHHYVHICCEAASRM